MISGTAQHDASAQLHPRTDARRTETCGAPRYIDASRDFILFYPNEQLKGGGGGLRCQIF